MAARLVVVSDSHLSDRVPDAVANWAAAVAHVGARRPDLVIHLGDVTLDAQHRPEELAPARRYLDELGAPWRAVPGNHDVGDDHANPDAAHRIDATRRDRWLDHVGPDRWSLDLGGWTVIGVDAQLFGTGLTAEAQQWDWLAATLEPLEPGRPTLLALHKPVDGPPAEVARPRSNRYVPAAARRRLAQLWAGRRPALTLSGHVHQQRDLDLDGHRHVWAPSTWGVFADRIQAEVGTKRTGLVDVALHDSGEVDATFVRPDGLAQLTVGVDTANPFA